MKSKIRLVISAIGVLLVVAAVSLLIPGKEPLYGQGNRGFMTIPDVTGIWDGFVGGCIFQDAYEGYPTDPQPVPDCTAWDDTMINITDQNRSVFAGLGEGPGDKFTGIIQSDGTLSWQGFDPSNHERVFGEGTLFVRGNLYRMTGYIHITRDPNKAPAGEAVMGTGYFLFEKRR